MNAKDLRTRIAERDRVLFIMQILMLLSFALLVISFFFPPVFTCAPAISVIILVIVYIFLERGFRRMQEQLETMMSDDINFEQKGS